MIACPFDPAEVLADPDWCLGLCDAEIVATCRLLIKSWNQVPPGSLPDDPRWLAAAAGLASTDWPSVSARVLRLFRLRDGRWHQDAVAAIHQRLSGRREADRVRKRAARGGAPPAPPCPSDVRRTSDGRPADIPRTAPPERSQSSDSGEAPALQRSPSAERSWERSPEGAPDDVIAILGAGARALYDRAFEEARARKYRTWVRSRLESARFGWATKEERRELHPTFVVRLMGLPGCTPERVAYALERIAEIGHRWVKAPEEREEPDGADLLTAALGGKRPKAGKSPPPPWDVPIAYGTTFNRQYGATFSIIDKQAAIDAANVVKVTGPRAREGTA